MARRDHYGANSMKPSSLLPEQKGKEDSEEGKGRFQKGKEDSRRERKIPPQFEWFKNALSRSSEVSRNPRS